MSNDLNLLIVFYLKLNFGLLYSPQKYRESDRGNMQILLI